MEADVSKALKWCLAVLWWLPLAASAVAPDLVLTDLDGRARRVSEFVGHGQWTVVAIWSTDCPLCQRDIHEMAFFHDAHRRKDAIVLGVSIDGPERHNEIAQFIDDHGLDFTNLIGSSAQMPAFGGPFRGTPTYYVYSPRGRLVARQVGPMTQEAVEAIMQRAAPAD
jgi:peroxiredoxin